MFTITLFVIYVITFSVKSEQANVIDIILDQCASEDQPINCLKIQALKISNRAIQSKSLNVMDGISLIRNNHNAKSMRLNINDSEIQNPESNKWDYLLKDTFARFLRTHNLNVNIPRLIEEGRKKQKGGGNGALYWALAIKGSFLAMAYKGIAVMAGLALIMGKMALLLAALLGLKKLVNNGSESTTFEIIKQPKYSEQYTYSTSYEDDGHHHRSYDYSDVYLPKGIYKTY